MPLRLAILTPFGPPALRGNAVTVARVAQGLAERGVEVRLWDLSAVDLATVDSGDPGLPAGADPRLSRLPVQARSALRLAHRVEVPLVVTLTGTDANHDLAGPGALAGGQNVLNDAHRITVFHQSVGDRVAAMLPGVGGRLVVVPQSVRLPVNGRFDLQERWPLPPGPSSSCFPSVSEAVKNPVFPGGAAGPAGQGDPRNPSAVCGADPGARRVGEALERQLSAMPWARYVGEVPHEQMASLLSQADVVLNCSISEGRHGELRARGPVARPRGPGLRHRRQSLDRRRRRPRAFFSATRPSSSGTQPSSHAIRRSGSGSGSPARCSSASAFLRHGRSTAIRRVYRELAAARALGPSSAL